MLKPVLFATAIVTTALGLAHAPPASAQTLRAEPAAIAKLIEAKGFKAEIVNDPGKDPVIRATDQGATFVVFFMGCTAHRDCATIQFYAGFTDSKVGIAGMNEWNKTRRFGRAYIDDEGDPVVEMDVDMDDGGMTPALFEDNLEFWMSILAGFSEFVYSDDAGTEQ
ncbi:MAG: YbjN domain-containing protein [Pseudomonadota bacterium]